METIQDRLRRVMPPAEFAYNIYVSPLNAYPSWQAVKVVVTTAVTDKAATMYSRSQAMDISALSDEQLFSWLVHHLDSIRNEMKIQAAKAKE